MCYNMNLQIDSHCLEMRALGGLSEAACKTPDYKEFKMDKKYDLTGQRFGRLTVIKRDYTKKVKFKATFWLCKCDCGNERITSAGLLRSGQTRSCGCIKKELLSKRSKTHGKSETKLYRRWNNMIERCYKSYSRGYKHYGARGITVCDEWRNDFEAYEKWCLENGYTEGCELSIDRINNDGNYEPSNCRLTTKTVQARNTQKLRCDNTSGYRGVSYLKKNRKYSAQIGISGKLVYLGSFQTALEAAKAYDQYVIGHNLEHTRNFT